MDKIGFSDGEIDTMFKKFWEDMVINKSIQTGKSYDLEGILYEFGIVKDRRKFIAYLINVYVEPNKVEKTIQDILDRHVKNYQMDDSNSILRVNLLKVLRKDFGLPVEDVRLPKSKYIYSESFNVTEDSGHIKIDFGGTSFMFKLNGRWFELSSSEWGDFSLIKSDMVAKEEFEYYE